MVIFFRLIALCIVLWMTALPALSETGSPSWERASGLAAQARQDPDLAPSLAWARWRPAPASARSSAQARAFWSQGACLIDLDAQAADRYWGGEPGFGARFAMLHEMGHCLFYASPRLPWRAAGFSGRAPDWLLDELLAMEAALSPMDLDDRYPLYPQAHEAFADAFALGWLARHGEPLPDLYRALERRDASPNDHDHAVSAPALRALTSWRSSGDALSAQREARLALAAWLLSEPSFASSSRIEPEQLADSLANAWCSFAVSADGARWRLGGEHDRLGQADREHPPLPALMMPSLLFLMPSDLDERSCQQRARSALLTRLKSPDRPEPAPDSGSTR